MKKEELYNKIDKTEAEQKEIISRSLSITQASRDIFGTDSTLGRTLIKELCKKYGIEVPDYHKSKENFCLNCGKKIVGTRRKFCCQSCAATYNNKLREKKPKRKCLYCGKEIDNRKKFCSTKCFNEFQYENYIKKWKNGETDGNVHGGFVSFFIRKYIFEKYDSHCCQCGWGEVNKITGKIPLQIHHIDGNCENNKEENLQLLCPNCHSLTETYGILNKGNSKRRNRHLRD